MVRNRSRAVLSRAFRAAWPVLGSLLALGAGRPACAGTFDLNLSDDSLRAALTLPLSFETAEVEFGWLHATGGIDVPSVGIRVSDYAGERGAVLVGVGAHVYYLDTGRFEGGALTLGGFARIPLAARDRAGVQFRIDYGPDASSFGDVSGFLEYGMRGFFEIIEPADVYVGYRRLRADLPGRGKTTIEQGLQFGVLLRF